MPRLTRACEACGTANPTRTAVLGIAIAAAILVPAIAVAIYAATQWERPLIEGTVPADQAASAPPSDDVSWLERAMKDCDAKAAEDPGALHFLVVPLAADAKLVEDWRLLALNRIGNAAVLPSEDILKGLQRRTLTLSDIEYVFSIRDERTREVRKWEPSTGVKWFSTAQNANIPLFRMQFKPAGSGSEEAWGNLITHRRGNCYWINALPSE